MSSCHIWQSAFVDAGRQQLQAVELADTHENLPPRTLEQITFRDSHFDENSKSLKILSHHLLDIPEVGELCQRGHKGCPWGIEVEVTGNANS